MPPGLGLKYCKLLEQIAFIYGFPMIRRKKKVYFSVQHKLICFYNPDEKCLQRGTDWGYK